MSITSYWYPSDCELQFCISKIKASAGHCRSGCFSFSSDRPTVLSTPPAFIGLRVAGKNAKRIDALQKSQSHIVRDGPLVHSEAGLTRAERPADRSSVDQAAAIKYVCRQKQPD